MQSEAETSQPRERVGNQPSSLGPVKLDQARASGGTKETERKRGRGGVG